MASTVRNFLPNLLTLGNLAAGSWAIALSYEREWSLFAIAMGVAMACDWLDGLLARLLNAESEIGKGLDSLADLVSFGIAPAFALYNYLKPYLLDLPYSREIRFWMVVAPFVLPLGAAWRLARFGVMELPDKRFFAGLPTPAHGAFWAGWVLTEPQGYWLHPAVWCGLIVLLGGAMVSQWSFLSLKDRRNIPWLLGWLLLSGVGIGLLPFGAWPPFLLGSYILVSALARGKKRR
jgi:CDP-diacylglycerol--serine O-phosphatidyltransferase